MNVVCTAPRLSGCRQHRGFLFAGHVAVLPNCELLKSGLRTSLFTESNALGCKVSNGLPRFRACGFLPMRYGNNGQWEVTQPGMRYA